MSETYWFSGHTPRPEVEPTIYTRQPLDSTYTYPGVPRFDFYHAPTGYLGHKKILNAIGGAKIERSLIYKCTLEGPIINYNAYTVEKDAHDYYRYVYTGEDGFSDYYYAKSRTAVGMIDGENAWQLMREFARWVAERYLNRWDAPASVVEYLYTGDETLRPAAEAAAWTVLREAEDDHEQCYPAEAAAAAASPNIGTAAGWAADAGRHQDYLDSTGNATWCERQYGQVIPPGDDLYNDEFERRVNALMG